MSSRDNIIKLPRQAIVITIMLSFVLSYVFHFIWVIWMNRLLFYLLNSKTYISQLLIGFWDNTIVLSRDNMIVSSRDNIIVSRDNIIMLPRMIKFWQATVITIVLSFVLSYVFHLIWVIWMNRSLSYLLNSKTYISQLSIGFWDNTIVLSRRIKFWQAVVPKIWTRAPLSDPCL